MTPKDEETLVHLEGDLQEAILRHDRRSLEDLLSDEFRTTGSSRLGTVDRGRWLDLATGGIEWDSFEFRSAKCLVLGDVGVVASVVNRQGTVAGRALQRGQAPSGTGAQDPARKLVASRR